MDVSRLDRLIEGLSCPTCGGRYSVEHVTSRPELPVRALVRCQACGRFGIGTVGVSDEPQPVTVLDVQRVGQFLRGFDGDFKALFQRREAVPEY